MTFAVYTRYELLRTFRNRRFFIFSLGFPLLLYVMVAGSNRNTHNLSDTGLSAALYFMVSYASWGTMTAMLSSGARIAGERVTGWNRQLRITPLSARSYFRAKVVTSYLMALSTLAVLYSAGAAFGVSLPAGRWLEMTGLILVGLIPFAAGGILIGHVATTDSIGPIMGGGVAILAFISGVWFPLGDSGFLHDVAQFLPSYWLVQAGHVALGGDAWPARAWICIAVWTIVMARLAMRAYRKDTGRQ
jgi:ABC-2 type transport system permease protein